MESSVSEIVDSTFQIANERHECTSYPAIFTEGSGGRKVGDYEFCPKCIYEFVHFDYFRQTHKLQDHQIYYLDTQESKPI